MKKRFCPSTIICRGRPPLLQMRHSGRGRLIIVCCEHAVVIASAEEITKQKSNSFVVFIFITSEKDVRWEVNSHHHGRAERGSLSRALPAISRWFWRGRLRRQATGCSGSRHKPEFPIWISRSIQYKPNRHPRSRGAGTAASALAAGLFRGAGYVRLSAADIQAQDTEAAQRAALVGVTYNGRHAPCGPCYCSNAVLWGAALDERPAAQVWRPRYFSGTGSKSDTTDSVGSTTAGGGSPWQ